VCWIEFGLARWRRVFSLAEFGVTRSEVEILWKICGRGGFGRVMVGGGLRMRADGPVVEVGIEDGRWLLR
jgi:hypothetical protein